MTCWEAFLRTWAITIKLGQNEDSKMKTKAIRIYKYGGPEVLQYEEIDLPDCFYLEFFGIWFAAQNHFSCCHVVALSTLLGTVHFAWRRLD